MEKWKKEQKIKDWSLYEDFVVLDFEIEEKETLNLTNSNWIKIMEK